MTQPDTPLHTRLEAEIDRRLAVARAATPGPWTATERYPYLVASPAYLSNADTAPDEDVWAISTNVTQRPLFNALHIALHDPADAIRRYEGELEVLERHAPEVRQASRRVMCVACNEKIDFNVYGEVPWPCAETKSLAHRLGVSVDV